MGKGRKRRNGQGRKAYLKHAKSFYDPYSPYAIRTRGIKCIDLAADVPVTITHGKRGLTIARADNLPRVQVMIRRQQITLSPAEAFSAWSTDRYNGLSEWHRVVLRRTSKLLLELWFQGKNWIFVEENYRLRTQRRSKSYSTKEQAYACLNGTDGRAILWHPSIPLPAPVMAAAESVSPSPDP